MSKYQYSKWTGCLIAKFHCNTEVLEETKCLKCVSRTLIYLSTTKLIYIYTYMHVCATLVSCLYIIHILHVCRKGIYFHAMTSAWYNGMLFCLGVKHSIYIKSSFVMTVGSQIANFMGQNGAHLGFVGPRWAPCWPYELCYLGCFRYSWRHLLYVRGSNVV